MPEEINGKKIFTLLEVSQSIQKMFAQHFAGAYWIKAEMSKLGLYAQSGHCFPELVEKIDGKIIARIDALLWKTDYAKVNANFKRVLNDELKDGIKILFLAKVEYSPEFGLKLRILDIDPAFTLGDFEREKQETIRKLIEEGIFTGNKAVKFPLLPQRIAIISDKDSRGYQDFLNVFEAAKKSWGYEFFYMIFPAALQGDKAIATIPAQLERIRKVRLHFDVVAIIRGGGGELSFVCYNNYALTKAIATFPLPVVTGIGHVTNLTVVDMVANHSAITPTKLAEYLIQKFHNFSVPVQDALKSISDLSRRLLTEEKTKFQGETKLFRSVTLNLLQTGNNSLKESSRSLILQSLFIFKRENECIFNIRKEIFKGYSVFCNSSKLRLIQLGSSIKKDTLAKVSQLFGLLSQKSQQVGIGAKGILKVNNSDLLNLQKNIEILSPENILKRGYSISLLNGKMLMSHKGVKKGDIIKTIIQDGEISSTVNNTSKSANQ